MSKIKERNNEKNLTVKSRLSDNTGTPSRRAREREESLKLKRDFYLKIEALLRELKEVYASASQSERQHIEARFHEFRKTILKTNSDSLAEKDSVSLKSDIPLPDRLPGETVAAWREVETIRKQAYLSKRSPEKAAEQRAKDAARKRESRQNARGNPQP